ELRRLAAACDLELRPPYRLLACALPADADADRLLGAAWQSSRALLVVADGGVWTALVDGDADVDALCRSGMRALAPGGDGALVVGVGQPRRGRRPPRGQPPHRRLPARADRRAARDRPRRPGGAPPPLAGAAGTQAAVGRAGRAYTAPVSEDTRR